MNINELSQRIQTTFHTSDVHMRWGILVALLIGSLVGSFWSMITIVLILGAIVGGILLISWIKQHREHIRTALIALGVAVFVALCWLISPTGHHHSPVDISQPLTAGENVIVEPNTNMVVFTKTFKSMQAYMQWAGTAKP